MAYRRVLCFLGPLLFVTGSLMAQEKPGNLVTLEFQKPKNGMVSQYQAGRKQKAAWHKQQNDSQALLVWEMLTGEQTGTYVVGRFGQHWADLDKPSIPDEADLAEYQKVIASYVDSLTTRYYEFMPKISNSPGGDVPTKFSEILTFYVRSGKGAEFQSGITRISEAAQKTKWPLKFEWYRLVEGGTADTFVLALPHSNWADFDDRPDVKPFRDMLKEGLGQTESDSIIHALDESVERQTVDVVQFHPELSYLPGK